MLAFLIVAQLSLDSPLCSTIIDSDGRGEYRIRSDSGDGGSMTYRDQSDGVISHFQVSGAYELSALSSSRKMFIDLSEPLNGTLPDGTLPHHMSKGFVAGRFVSKFVGIDGMVGVGTMMIGGFPFVFRGADGTGYQIRMNAEKEKGTTDAMVTCTHTDPQNRCDAWCAEPVGGGKAVGRLAKFEEKDGNMTSIYYGDFYVTYCVEFRRPERSQQ